MINKSFIAGLFSSSGYFYTEKNKCNGKEYKRFQIGIHFHASNRELLDKVVKFVGIGKVRTRKNRDKESIQWTLTRKDDIRRFITEYKTLIVGYKRGKMLELEKVMFNL